MTVSYNLIYWNNCHGRGEVTRLLFTYARQAFEEATFTNEEWPALKAQQPYGQLPVLEVDGVKIAQSRAIERFLARRFNLVGKNDIERAINDQIICGIDDTRQHFAKMFNEDDTLKSEAEVKAIIDEHVVSFLERHDKFLAINRHNHFVGHHTTHADLAIFQILYFLTHVNKTILSKYEHLQKFFKQTSENPKLKNYLETRMQSPF